MKTNLQLVMLCGIFLSLQAVQAQLLVKVSPPKISGQKVLVRMDFKNAFADKVTSARAVVFLLDEKGKMISQETRWVIGGRGDRPALSIGSTNTFNFVLTSVQPFSTTNLATKVSFSQLVLEGGKTVDPSKNVRIEKLE